MIADMMAEYIADEVPTIVAIRPVNGSLNDAYPWVAYETIDMRNRRRLNCTSKRYDGSVRYYVSGRTYAEVIATSEAIKTALLAYSEDGAVYKVRRCNLVDETDIAQEVEDNKKFFVKSLDFTVAAVKV